MKRSYPDRDVWVESYREENGGLQDSDTYEVISEEEYQRLRRQHGDAIPSMVVQTVKSVHGVPTRVKSRIVVLGNLEQHNWSKSDCYAPVMPLYQVRLLVSLAVANFRFFGLQITAVLVTHNFIFYPHHELLAALLPSVRLSL